MTVRASDTTAQRPGIGCLNNRYHDPTLGSFLSVDPLVAQTGDPYVYGAANPTTYSDPDGLDPDTSAWIRDEVEANGGCTYSSGLQCFLDKGSNPPEDGTLDVSAWYNDGLYQYGRASAGYGRVPGYGIQERGDGGPDWLDRLGHSVRFAANLPLTTPSVMWAVPSTTR